MVKNSWVRLRKIKVLNDIRLLAYYEVASFGTTEKRNFAALSYFQRLKDP